MALPDVVFGLQTYNDYITSRDQIKGFESALATNRKGLEKTMRVGLNQESLRMAIDSGFGALNDNMISGFGGLGAGIEQLTGTVEFGFVQLSDGIEKLNADFNLLMGDVIWKLEMQNELLTSLVQTLQAPLDTAAKELRHRAEDAYQNGWYEEALADFLESEKKNYQDFAVHRSIGNIYFYHQIDLPKATEYFRKAAKYAEPRDGKQSAEAHYFAGVACAAQQQLEHAIQHMQRATALDPIFYDAHYMLAAFSSALGKFDSMSLARAIDGDSRYFERAKNDAFFKLVRSQVQAFLDRLFSGLSGKASVEWFTIEALHESNSNIVSEDAGPLHEIFAKAKNCFSDSSYTAKVSLLNHCALYKSRFQQAQLKRGQKEAEDRRIAQQRLEWAERERNVQDDIRARTRENQYQEGMKTAGIWFKSSIRYAIIAYFVVAFGGCVVRMGMPRLDAARNPSAAFASYVNEGLYIAVVIIIAGTIASVAKALSTKANQ